VTGPVNTPEDDASEDIAANTSGYPTDELLDRSINDSTGDNENPFHALPENRDVTPIPEENPFEFVPENQGVTPIPKIPETEFIPENRRVAPIPEPDLHDRHVTPISEENPFDFVSENCGVAPTPDLHLHGDDGGPSEPIAWAFQRQGLGDGSAIDSRTSSLGAFGGHSPRHILLQNVLQSSRIVRDYCSLHLSGQRWRLMWGQSLEVHHWVR